MTSSRRGGSQRKEIEGARRQATVLLSLLVYSCGPFRMMGGESGSGIMIHVHTRRRQILTNKAPMKSFTPT